MGGGSSGGGGSVRLVNKQTNKQNKQTNKQNKQTKQTNKQTNLLNPLIAPSWIPMLLSLLGFLHIDVINSIPILLPLLGFLYKLGFQGSYIATVVRLLVFPYRFSYIAIINT